MTSWTLRIAVTGLSLILAGFLFGLAFSWAVDHEARLVAHDAYRPVFEQIANSGNGDAWPAMERRISERSVAHRRAADTHGHSVNMGILLVLFGLLAPIFADRSGSNGRLLLLLGISAVVYPIGLSLQFFMLTLVGEIVSAAGAIGAIAALVALLIRFWKAVDRLEGLES